MKRTVPQLPVRPPSVASTSSATDLVDPPTPSSAGFASACLSMSQDVLRLMGFAGAGSAMPRASSNFSSAAPAP